MKTKIITQHGKPLIVPENFEPSEQRLREPKVVDVVVKQNNIAEVLKSRSVKGKAKKK